MEKLYRIVSFPGFVNLIESKSERFVQPIKWEDTYEGYMLRLLEEPAKRRDIIKLLYEEISPNVATTIKNYMNLWAARWLCYGQCWSKTPESDALWRIYSYDRMSVRIETTDEMILSQINNSDLSEHYSIEIADVNYDLDNGDVLKTQAELLKEYKRTVEPFYHKRKAFEHENEKRVIIFDKGKTLFNGLATKGALFNYNKENSGKTLAQDDMFAAIEKEIVKMQDPFAREELETEKFIEIKELSHYIKSAMVHPQADKWIVELVGKICKREGINFLGKSHMYDALV